MTTLHLDRAPGDDRVADGEPWRHLVTTILREAASPAWDTVEPALAPDRAPDAPLLTGACISLGRGLVIQSLARLQTKWPDSGTPELGAIAGALATRDDGVALVAAAVQDDEAAIARMAERRAIDLDALQAVASLLAVPILQACQRQAWQGDEGWRKGYCPTCGSWPAFVEVIDTDRIRQFRCARCGAGWPAALLTCPACGTTDNDELVRLVPADESPDGSVEACARCAHYTKVFTVLQPSAPLDVVLRDLATVVLDVAALDRGYRRPGRTGYPLGLKVTIE